MTHDFKGLKMGFGITGSYCTFEKSLTALKKLVDTGAIVYPIVSENVQHTNTRFGKYSDTLDKIKEISGVLPIATIKDAEPIGPNSLLDVLVIAPCTGNTIAKLANGIVDTPILMAAKAHLRNNKPLVIALSTNDALGLNLKNIGILINTKNIYFVPFGQDNCVTKPNSMIANMELIIPTIDNALSGIQLQPVLTQK